MKKITFVTFLSLNLNFDTQFEEFDVGNKGWKHKVFQTLSSQVKEVLRPSHSKVALQNATYGRLERFCTSLTFCGP